MLLVVFILLAENCRNYLKPRTEDGWEVHTKRPDTLLFRTSFFFLIFLKFFYELWFTLMIVTRRVKQNPWQINTLSNNNSSYWIIKKYFFFFWKSENHWKIKISEHLRNLKNKNLLAHYNFLKFPPNHMDMGGTKKYKIWTY